MLERFRIFLRGLATNWTGTAGVVLTTTAFLLFVFMELLRLAGLVTNAYVGLVTYMALPAVFLCGLLLIPVGWWRFRRASGLTLQQLLLRRFPEEMVRGRLFGSNLLGMIALLTAVNLMFFGLGGARVLHFMDEPVFCGTACHAVMNPEWVTYQDSPHAHVRCVDCHVGEGTEALIDAKLNGLWQVVSATFDLYERPIPTPVHNLRPARETCETCHWPDKFYGQRIRTLTSFALDEASTPRFTTLSLKVGSGRAERSGTIHWHIAADNAVRYQPVDERRLEMAWVEVRRGDRFHRYENRRLAAAGESRPGELPPPVRTLDCVDCHNRATHIYQDPERALDAAFADGRLSRGPPHAKRVALGALLGDYAGREGARRGIADEITGHYRRQAPDRLIALADEIERMVAVVQEIHARNIHPGMNIGWNTYVSHLGHRNGAGCARCHNPDLVDADGRSIPYDCTLCHSILAYDSPEPFRFLQPPDEADPDYRMHRYLRQEFVGQAAP